MYGKSIHHLESTADLTSRTVVTGEFVAESSGPVDGDVDSFGSVRFVEVRVVDVVHGAGVTEGQTVSVENGMYEWSDRNDRNVDRADKLAAPGQPWLATGEDALLVLDKASRSGQGWPQESFHSFGQDGTFRVVDGKISASPRDSAMLTQGTLSEEIVGLTPSTLRGRL